MRVSLALTDLPTYEREPVNTRADVSGLHPATSTSCLTLRQIIKKDLGWTIEHFNDLTPEYKAWWVKRARRYGLV